MQANQLLKTCFLLFALTTLFTGCATNTPDRGKITPKDPEVSLARQAVARADYARAAEHYLALADRNQHQARAGYQLLAAENLFLAEDITASRATLVEIDAAALDTTNAFKLKLLHAELDLKQNQHQSAISMLEDAPPPGTSRQLLTRFYQDRALAYRLAGDINARNLALLQLDKLFFDPEQRLNNQLDILHSLLMTGPLADDIADAAGWNELAEAAAGAGDDYYPEYLKWRTRYPDHPAMDDLLRRFNEQQAQLQVETDRIAIFLPDSGRYATAANAIRNGIVANWYQTPESQRPSLTFYDSSDSSLIWPLYQQALEEGAQVIIGPLQKKAVLQLARAGELAIPVLALNQVSTDSIPPENLFQFSLSPEDEAEQVARYAMQAEHSNALVLYPENEWGGRIARAFSVYLESLGGRATVLQPYNPAGPDYSEAIKSALLLNQSSARNAEMQRLLGKNLKFTPRRRADVDYIFLIAKPRQARQIYPQLQFFYAADLPVFSTAQAWNGSLSRQQALDVEGIQLPDMPWYLTQDPQDPLAFEPFTLLFPNSKSSLGRLYAMGMDSYTLLPDLRRLQFSKFESVDGRTGNLYMDYSRQLRRLLVWAELGETPRILGYSTRHSTTAEIPQAIDPVSAPETPAGNL